MELHTVIDIIIIGLCIVLGVRGFFVGFVHEVMSLLAFVAGYFAVATFKTPMTGWIENKTSASEIIALAVSVVVLFVIAYFLVKITETLLARFINLIMLSALNRVAGFFVGVLKSAVIVLLIAFIIREQPLFPLLAESLQFDKSAVLSYFEVFYQKLFTLNV